MWNAYGIAKREKHKMKFSFVENLGLKEEIKYLHTYFFNVFVNVLFSCCVRIFS